MLRYVFFAALGFQAGCGLTLDLDDPDFDSAVDGGAVDGGIGDGAVMDGQPDSEVDQDGGVLDSAVDAFECRTAVDCVPEFGLCAECGETGMCTRGDGFVGGTMTDGDGVRIEYCDPIHHGPGVLDVPGPTDCVAGEPGCVSAPNPVEICDGVDNDGDGSVDEGCSPLLEPAACTHIVEGNFGVPRRLSWEEVVSGAGVPEILDGAVICFVARTTFRTCNPPPSIDWVFTDTMPRGIDMTLVGGLRQRLGRIVPCTGERTHWPAVQLFGTTQITSHVRLESLTVQGPLQVAAAGHLDLQSAAVFGNSTATAYLIQVEGALTAYDSHIEDRAPGRNLIETDNAALTIVASELIRGADGYAIHATHSSITLQNNCTLVDGTCEPEILAIGGHAEKPGIYGQDGASALYMMGGQLSAIRNTFVSIRTEIADLSTVFLSPRSASLQSNWIGNFGGSVGLEVENCGNPDACVSDHNTILMVPARTGVPTSNVRGASILGPWSFQGDEIGVLGVNPEVHEVIGVLCTASATGGCAFREGTYMGSLLSSEIPPIWLRVLGGLNWSFVQHRPALSIGIQCEGCSYLSNLDAHGGTATDSSGDLTVGVAIRILDAPAGGTILSGIAADAGEAGTESIGLDVLNGLVIVINSTVFGGEGDSSTGLAALSPVHLRNVTAIGGTLRSPQTCAGARIPESSVVLSSMVVAACDAGVGLSVSGVPEIVLDVGFILVHDSTPHNLTETSPLLDPDTFITSAGIDELGLHPRGLRPCMDTALLGTAEYATQTDQEGDTRDSPPTLGALRRAPCM